MMGQPRCGNCHQILPKGVHPYTMRIELFPRLEDSVEITDEDLEIDFDEEIKKVIAKLELMSEEKRIEQEERVYASYSFALCGACRDDLARRLHLKTLAS